MTDNPNKTERNRTSDGLSGKMEKAALALAGGKAIQHVCSEVGIGRTTLWNWLKQEAFRNRVDELRRQLVDAAVGELADLLALAGKAYRDLLTAPDVPGRLKLDTANAVHDRFVNTANWTDLKQQVETLKAAVAKQGGKHNA